MVQIMMQIQEFLPSLYNGNVKFYVNVVVKLNFLVVTMDLL